MDSCGCLVLSFRLGVPLLALGQEAVAGQDRASDVHIVDVKLGVSLCKQGEGNIEHGLITFIRGSYQRPLNSLLASHITVIGYTN